jgi:hypothetical protein
LQLHSPRPPQEGLEIRGTQHRRASRCMIELGIPTHDSTAIEHDAPGEVRRNVIDEDQICNACSPEPNARTARPQAQPRETSMKTRWHRACSFYHSGAIQACAMLEGTRDADA